MSESKNSHVLVNLDTDSISFCKQDGSKFSDSELENILLELNNISPEKIVWELEGQFDSVLVIKTKNYALYDGKKITIKGSALKATQKEPALREMLHRMIKSLLGVTDEDLHTVYLEYVKEAYKLKDITRWGAKKSVTESVLKPTRTNEAKVLEAIKGKGLQVGEKFYVFFKSDDSLSTIEDFDGDYNVDKLLEKVYKTVDILKTVVNVKELFPNYKLKKNKLKLELLINPPRVRKGVVSTDAK